MHNNLNAPRAPIYYFHLVYNLHGTVSSTFLSQLSLAFKLSASLSKNSKVLA